MQGQASLLNQTAQGNATPGQQAQLQTDLKYMEAALAKAGIPNLPGLQGAAKAMGDAQSALTQHDDGNAQTAETSAIQNLQKAATALQNETAQSLSLGMSGEMLNQNPSGNDPNGSNDDLSIPALPLQRTTQPTKSNRKSSTSTPPRPCPKPPMTTCTGC